MEKIKFYIHPADKTGVDITQFWEQRINGKGKLQKVEHLAFYILFPTKDCEKYLIHVRGWSELFADSYEEALHKGADFLNEELDIKTFEYVKPGYEFIKTDRPWPNKK